MSITKAPLYEQVARLGKALSSPKRLELIELLCQGEKTVEVLADQAGIGVKLTSAHLKELRQARLVDTRKDGKHVHYRLASPGVAALWVSLRSAAHERLVELQVALATLVREVPPLHDMDRKALWRAARAGEVIVIDVRPTEEYDAAHLPHARSLPLAELRRRLNELSPQQPVVAYCRGPFCLFARDAVALLRQHGFQAEVLSDGVAEWRAQGLPIATTANGRSARPPAPRMP